MLSTGDHTSNRLAVIIGTCRASSTISCAYRLEHSPVVFAESDQAAAVAARETFIQGQIIAGESIKRPNPISPIAKQSLRVTRPAGVSVGPIVELEQHRGRMRLT